MTAASLKRKLKNTTGLPEELGIRLHRSISWLQCAEDNVKDPDLHFVGQWIAFNSLYVMDYNERDQKTEENGDDAVHGGIVRSCP